MTNSIEKVPVNPEKAALIESACTELLSYGVWDTKTRWKRFVKKNLLRRQTTPEDVIFWPTGLLAYGLWHNRWNETVILRQKTDAALSLYFERWMKRQCQVLFLEDLLSGEVFLAAYEEYATGESRDGIVFEQNAGQYREAIDRMAEYALTYPTDETGSFPYRAAQNTGHIFVDSIGLACPFLYEYGRYFDREECMEIAVRQIANFLAYGMDTATGLPYHGYHMDTQTKYGIIGWGRAAGWLLRGMIGCMTTVYGASQLQDPYCSLIDSILLWQRKDGYFSWQLQAVEGPEDTSATGLICVALQEGIRRKFLQGEEYEKALEKGIRAIQKSTKNGRVYQCSGECTGFSQYPQIYGDYPWAMGPALLLI